MREAVEDVFGVAVGDELIDVATQPLDVLVLGLGDAPRQDVDDGAVLGKASRHLLRDEDVRAVVSDLEAAGDRVVIGDRHHGHAALEQPGVGCRRLGVRLVHREAGEDERLVPTRVLRVHVKVK